MNISSKVQDMEKEMKEDHFHKNSKELQNKVFILKGQQEE